MPHPKPDKEPGRLPTVIQSSTFVQSLTKHLNPKQDGTHWICKPSVISSNPTTTAHHDLIPGLHRLAPSSPLPIFSPPQSFAPVKRIVPEDFAPSNTKTKHIQHSTDVGPPTEVRSLPSRRRHQHTNDEIDFNFCPSVKKALQSDGHPDPSPAPVPTIVTTAQLKSALEQAGLHVRSQRHSSLLAQYKILLDPSRLVDMSSNKAVSSSADFLSHPPSLPGSEVLSPCHSHSPPTSSESTFMSTQATSSSTSVNDHGTSSTSVNAIAPSGPPPLPPGPHQTPSMPNDHLPSATEHFPPTDSLMIISL
ncbi:hypothetical protein H4Q26_012668 [Puccinia striiformis f. sp. tritici PST-130]|nr:hypothetical protein H4Q26_012668 [Puccinia striiformis f. sp. tritici PST-130]